MSAATKRNAAPSGEGRGAMAEGKTEKAVNYRSADAASSKAKPRRAKPPLRPSAGVPPGSSSVAVNAHVAKVLKAAMADDGLSPSTKVVCYWIAHHISRSGPRSGHAWPTVRTLQLLCGCKKRSVQNAVEALEEAGYMLRTVNAGRSSEGNDYQLRLPEGAPDWREKVQRGAPFNDQSDAEKVHEAAPFNDEPDAEKVQDCDAKRCTEMHPILLSDTHKGPKGPIMDSSKHTTETSTVDARAPEGASASEEIIDATDPPDDDVPSEVRAQWDAEYLERFGREQYDGDEGEPIEDVAPEQHATEEVQDRHATAAHRPPVADDDHIPLEQVEAEADAEPEPAKPHDPQVTITEAEHRVLRAIVGSEFQDGTDSRRCWVWAYSANPDGETDPFDESGNFAHVLASVVRKGLAAVRHNEGTDDEVRITAEGMAVFQEQHGRGGATAAAGTR
ncbi:MAG: hypothetical protein B7Y80_20115 [Hyphomicrobium sp. 32-62-53]|nr:MAG: hypothetical protein B7Z29_19945 [Hyphomicrobium sp. 12-62-95]OYX97339.1 MAG: hypothetical protein B7Y80_20115 [Hyphomicrobium sp. 32-62-53]